MLRVKIKDCEWCVNNAKIAGFQKKEWKSSILKFWSAKKGDIQLGEPRKLSGQIFAPKKKEVFPSNNAILSSKEVHFFPNRQIKFPQKCREINRRPGSIRSNPPRLHSGWAIYAGVTGKMQPLNFPKSGGI